MTRRRRSSFPKPHFIYAKEIKKLEKQQEFRHGLKLRKVFNPSIFEKNVYVADFYTPGKPLTDRYTRRITIIADSQTDAEQKAMEALK